MSGSGLRCREQTPPVDGRNHREFMAIFNSPQQENGIVANRVQAELRDAGGLVLDDHNKADTRTVTRNFSLPSPY